MWFGDRGELAAEAVDGSAEDESSDPSTLVMGMPNDGSPPASTRARVTGIRLLGAGP